MTLPPARREREHIACRAHARQTARGCASRPAESGPRCPLFARGDRRMLVGLLGGAQRVDFLREAVDVLERAVDRRETDVRDLIERLELGQHALADVARYNLRDAELADLALDVERERRHLIARYRPLRERRDQAVLDLVAIERLAPAVGLDHHRHRLFDPLVRGEPPRARFALAPPPDL